MKQGCILVIDDERSSRIILKQILEQDHYLVLETDRAQEGFKLVHNHNPDVIVVDGIMPGMDGFTFCSELEKLYPPEQCPQRLILIPSENNTEIDLAFRAGATDYIKKPINKKSLLQRVKNIFEKKQLQKQVERQQKTQQHLQQQLVQLQQEIQRFVNVDGLTNVGNQIYWEYCLQQSWQEGTLNNSPISLLLCSIDYFPIFRYTYGHEKSDQCLVEIASLIQKNLKRTYDVVARFDTSIFSILLPRTPLEGALKVANTIANQLEEHPIPHQASPIHQHITLSIGIASGIPQTILGTEVLVDNALTALKKAETNGGNCLEWIA